MREEYRSNLEGYLLSMAQARRMVDLGILTSQDYATIDTKIANKYGVSSCSLYRGIDLLYQGFRANMAGEEVG